MSFIRRFFVSQRCAASQLPRGVTKLGGENYAEVMLDMMYYRSVY